MIKKQSFRIVQNSSIDEFLKEVTHNLFTSRTSLDLFIKTEMVLISTYAYMRMC